MNILYASPEAFPFAKTGGLADVVGALSQTLSKTENIALCLPEYSLDAIMHHKKKTIDSFKVVLGKREFSAIIKSIEVNEQFRVFFVSQDLFFSRKFLYGNGESDYPDNFYRFLFFQKALIQFYLRNQLQLDVVHCNDWQTALIPLYLKLFSSGFRLHQPKTVFTIHNLGYQGIFDHFFFSEMDLPENYFSPEYLEFHGQLNFLKGGIIFSDVLVTVSPSYAREILEPGKGFGLDGLMQKHSHKMRGILNGIDYAIWNPETDSFIFQKYKSQTLSLKGKNKTLFFKQEGVGLEPQIPMLVFIGRLVDHKGATLLIQLLPELLREQVFVTVLGMGNPEHETALRKMAQANADRFRFYNFFDEKLAHQLQAAADILLMPSLYEPCGLNQMCSLRYGAVPVAMKTGGLQDTIIDVGSFPSQGTGFLCAEPTKDHFLAVVKEAVNLTKDKTAWSRIQKRGMAADFSWGKVSGTYLSLYRESIVKENHHERNHRRQ